MIKRYTTHGRALIQTFIVCDRCNESKPMFRGVDAGFGYPENRPADWGYRDVKSEVTGQVIRHDLCPACDRAS